MKFSLNFIVKISFFNKLELMMLKQKKLKFSEEEDSKLKQYLAECPNPALFQWNEILKHFPSRTERQLRDRWRFYLDPNIKQTLWTPEEDILLLHGHSVYGNSWKLICLHYLPDRSEISIRNRYKGIENFKRKNRNKSEVFTFNLDGIEASFLHIKDGGFYPL
jgi:hypothetical protein